MAAVGANTARVEVENNSLGALGAAEAAALIQRRQLPERQETGVKVRQMAIAGIPVLVVKEPANSVQYVIRVVTAPVDRDMC
jgi:hypothetical protein